MWPSLPTWLWHQWPGSNNTTDVTTSFDDSNSRPWQKGLSYHLFFLPQFLATGPSPGGASESEFQLTLLFLVFSIVVTYKCFYSSDSNIENELKASAAALKHLGDEYDALAEEIHVRIKDLVNKQMDWVQHALNGKASHYRAFLQRITQTSQSFSDQSARFGSPAADAKLARPFAQFTRSWLSMFSQCSNNPLHSPHKIVDDSDVDACDSVPELCELILQSFHEEPILLLQHPEHASILKLGHEWDEVESILMKPFDVAQPDITRGTTIDLREACFTWLQVCGLNRYYVGARRTRPSWAGIDLPFELDACVVKIVLITEIHAIAFATFVLGFFFCVSRVYLGDDFLSVLTLGAQSVLLTVLFHFEKRDAQGQMSRETAQIEIETRDLEERHGAVSDFFNNVDRLSDLWTYRTRPCLALMKEFYQKLESETWREIKEAAEFLSFANDVVDRQKEQLGSLETWVGQRHGAFSWGSVLGLYPGEDGDKRLSEEACKILRNELDRCVQLTRASTVAELLARPEQFNILSLVAVRVVRGIDLHPGSLYDMSDPYVQLRVGKAGPWRRTQSLENCLNPDWHYAGHPAEFHFNVPTLQAEPLYVEVRDDAYAGPHELLGTAQIHFRKLEPGVWHSVHVELKDADQGELVLEVYCAPTAEHLIGLVPPVEPPAPIVSDEEAADDNVAQDGASQAQGRDKGQGAGGIAAPALKAASATLGPGATMSLAAAATAS